MIVESAAACRVRCNMRLGVHGQRCCAVPPANQRISHEISVARRILEKPLEKAVPFTKVTGRVKRPTKFFECPVHLCAVPCHGRCDPVGFTVSAATSDRYNMIDRGPNLPEGRVRHYRFPVWMIWEFVRKNDRQDTQDRQENESLAGVSVQESVAHENTCRLLFSILPNCRRCWREGVIPPQPALGNRILIVSEGVADLTDHGALFDHL